MFTIQTAGNQFLSSLNTLEGNITRTNRQVSSGLRVQTVSDDPNSVSEILQLNAQIATNNQIQMNLASAQTEVNTAENAIASGTQLMDRASSMAAEGSSTGSPSNRPQLALQVKDLISEMQQLANTSVQGRFIFSGNLDQTAPYGAVDLTTPTGMGSYQGGASTRSVIDPYGVSITIANTAQQVFDGGPAGTPSSSVIQALTELYNALNANDPAATATAASDVKSAANYLDGQQAIYGDIQNRITDAMQGQSTLATNLQAQLGTVQDADTAQAIVRQQSEATALNAAETAYASLPKKSLFDYLA